jgi:protein SCO1/2
MRTLACAAALLAAGLAAAGPPADPADALLREVRFDQRLGERVPADIPFRDESGQEVQVGRYFGDRPVILVLAYLRCPRLCTEVLNDLLKGLRGVPFTAGQDFQVVVVSFDARETPELAAAKRQTYVEEYGRPGAGAGWHFLTGEQPAIDRLCAAVGFKAVYDPQHDQFAHASGLTVLAPGGRVSRYLFGLGYSPRDLRFALVESSEGKVGSPVDQILLRCFHYDPVAGRYSAAVLSLVRAGGVLTVAGLLMFWLAAARRGRRARGHAVAG